MPDHRCGYTDCTLSHRYDRLVAPALNLAARVASRVRLLTAVVIVIGDVLVTAVQRLILAAIMTTLVALPGVLLYAALHAHGPAPAVPPAPSPVVVVSA